jgi:hypothetical protein
MSGNSKIIMRLMITQQQSMSNFFRKTKLPVKVLLRLAVSESGISEPVFFKAGLAVKKEVYISKCLPELYKFFQKHHKNKKSCSGLI